LAATPCIPKFSVRISRHMVFEIRTSSTNFTNGQVTIGTNHFPNFLDVCFIFWCWRLSRLFTVLYSTSALFRMFVPLMGLCSTPGFVHQTFILTLWKTLKKVSLIWNKISHRHIPHDNHPFLVAEHVWHK
jgi:hypothetical protein